MTGSPEQDNAARPILDFLKRALANREAKTPLYAGLCGSQGAGKSTVTAQLKAQLTADGWRVLTVSLDDLYLTRKERANLADTVHPLLATRGVPGTHDITLAHALFDSAAGDGLIRIPAFSKAVDDRVDAADWDSMAGPADLVLLEGWCVGASPQPEEALEPAVNALESEEDAQGIWRRHVNRKLEQDYRTLFDRLDLLIMIAAPSFEVVYGWRKQQEDALRKNAAGAGIMDDQQLLRFIQHYERLTRHILATMPDQADLVVRIDEGRRVVSVKHAVSAPSADEVGQP